MTQPAKKLKTSGELDPVPVETKQEESPRTSPVPVSGLSTGGLWKPRLRSQAASTEQTSSITREEGTPSEKTEIKESSDPGFGPLPPIDKLIEYLGDDGKAFLKDAELEKVFLEVQSRMKTPLLSIKVATSGGVSLTFISSSCDFVLQHYLNADAMKGVRLVFDEMRSNRSMYGADAAKDFAHLAEITHFDEALRLAQMEKLLPLTEIYNLAPVIVSNEKGKPGHELFADEGEVEKMREQLRKGISALHDFSSLRTKDERISNVGIKKSGAYALFDYNLAGQVSEKQEAYKTLDESIGSVLQVHGKKAEK